MKTFEIFYEGNLRTRVVHPENDKVILTDAPKDNQGKGEEFSPTDLLALSLGSCVLTLMGIFAEKKGLDLSGASIQVEKEMHLSPRRIGKLHLFFKCPQTFEEEMRLHLEKVGKNCPVHLSLHPEIEQRFEFTWG